MHNKVKNLIFSFILLSIAFIGLELIFRAWDILSGQIISDEVISLIYKNNTATHPYLIYTSKKNFSGFLQHDSLTDKFFVQTNSHGFRTHEFYPKMPGYLRIVLLGDSFTYGWNVDQDKTSAAHLERLLQDNISEKIEVLSLGVNSYSCVNYALLSRIYLDYLKPDIVIVCVDQSDFENDLKKIGRFKLDNNGVPIILKESDMVRKEKKGIRMVIDETGTIKILSDKDDWKMRLIIGSSLCNRIMRLRKFVNTKELKRRIKHVLSKDYPVVKYDDLAAPEPKSNIITYKLDRAIDRYQTSFACLKYIKRECDKRDIKLYFSSYPYAWEISISEAIPYQIFFFNRIYDFRKHRVHPRILDVYSKRLNVVHLNSYSVFEEDNNRKYNEYDPHFNEYGHFLYAKFLFNSIKADVSKN